MTVAFNKIGQVMVMSPAGRLDAETAPHLQDEIMTHVDGGETSVLLELSGVDYVSSAGLRAILLIAKKLQELDGRFALCGMSEPIANVFQVTGFDAILDIHPDQEGALAVMAG